MDKAVVIKTRLENPPEELVYCWREPYERFPVREDGTVEGLSVDHPRYVILKYEWKLEEEEIDVDERTNVEEEIDVKDNNKDKSLDVKSKVEEVSNNG